MTTRLSLTLLAAAAALVAAPVAAQLLPGGGGGVIGGVVGGVTRTIGDVAGPVLGDSDSSSLGERSRLVGGAFDRVSVIASSVAGSADSLLDLRRLRLSLLVDAHRDELAKDEDGNVVRRDRLLVVEPDASSLAAAARAGFRIGADQPQPELGLHFVTLGVPAGMSPRKALAALRRAAPGLDADYDHVFEPAGGALGPVAVLLASGAAGLASGGTRIAMIDGGVASHPSIARADRAEGVRRTRLRNRSRHRGRILAGRRRWSVQGRRAWRDAVCRRRLRWQCRRGIGLDHRPRAWLGREQASAADQY